MAMSALHTGMPGQLSACVGKSATVPSTHHTNMAQPGGSPAHNRGPMGRCPALFTVRRGGEVHVFHDRALAEREAEACRLALERASADGDLARKP